MKRRLVLSAVVMSMLGGVAAPALADAASSKKSDGNSYPQVCVLGTNHENGTRDGICVGIPNDLIK